MLIEAVRRFSRQSASSRPSSLHRRSRVESVASQELQSLHRQLEPSRHATLARPPGCLMTPAWRNPAQQAGWPCGVSRGQLQQLRPPIRSASSQLHQPLTRFLHLIFIVPSAPCAEVWSSSSPGRFWAVLWNAGSRTGIPRSLDASVEAGIWVAGTTTPRWCWVSKPFRSRRGDRVHRGGTESTQAIPPRDADNTASPVWQPRPS